MYEIIKIGNKFGWYQHDDAGNTTKEGKELFATQDEAQNFIDKLGGKSENTVEVLSDTLFHIIKVGNKFGWYEQDEAGNTVREGTEFFTRQSEAQAFLNEKFPVSGEKVSADGLSKEEADKANAEQAAKDAADAEATKKAEDEKAIADAAAKHLEDLKAGTVEFPYTFIEADLVAYPVLVDNGVVAGDIVDNAENLTLAFTPKA